MDKRHSPRDHRGDALQQEKKATLQGALMSWGMQREIHVRKGKERVNQGQLTFWRPQGGHIKVQKRM